MNFEILGWIATACFVGSYFADPKMLRVIQGLAAGLWIVYGVAIRSMPVITANSLVVVFSLISMFKLPSGRKGDSAKKAPTSFPSPREQAERN
jgi:hypothetical protein